MAPPLPRATADGPSSLQIGYAKDGTDSIEFSIPEGADADTGFLKIFLSTSYVDMHHIVQDAEPASDTHAPRGARQKPNPHVFKDDWDEWLGIITCKHSSQKS